MPDFDVLTHLKDFEPTLSPSDAKKLSETIEDVLLVFDEDGFVLSSGFRLSLIKGMATGMAKGLLKPPTQA